MRGSAFIEFLAGFPFLLIIFLFLIQLAIIWTGKLLISYACYSAVRIASMRPTELSKAEEYVRRSFILFGGDFSLNFFNENGERVEELKAGERFRVELEWRFKLSVPIVNALMGKWSIRGRYLPLKEVRTGTVEKCPGWERGICVE